MSLRDVEDLLAERGDDVSYETVRRWVARFGPAYARRLRAMRPRPCDTWHLDEVFVSVGGRMMYLWRAVDVEGEVLDVLVQQRRDKRAALKLMHRLLRRQGFTPRVIVTEMLRSYGAALREVGLIDRHVTGGRSNNRAENSHQPVRRRERSWTGFKKPGSTQRFLSVHAVVYNTFNVQRHLISRRIFGPSMAGRFPSGWSRPKWHDETGDQKTWVRRPNARDNAPRRPLRRHGGGPWARIQREGEVVHLIAHRLTDLTDALRGMGSRDAAFPLPHGGHEVEPGSLGYLSDGSPRNDRRSAEQMHESIT